MEKIQGSVRKAQTAQSSTAVRVWTAICNYFHIDSQHFPDRRQRAEAVIALSFMLVYTIAWTSYIPLYAFVFENMIAALAVAAIGLPTGLGSLVIQRVSKNLSRACALLNYGTGLTLIGCIFATGGTWSPIYFWTFSPVAGAYLLSGAKHGIALTAIIAVGNALVAFSIRPHENPERWYFQFEPFSIFHVSFFALTVFLSMLVFSLILYLFQNKIKQAMQQSDIAREEAEEQKQRAEAAFETIRDQMVENKAIMDATKVALVMIFPDMKIAAEKSSAYFQELFPGILDFSQALKKMRLESTSDVLQSVLGEDELTWSINSGSFPLEALIDGNIHELEWRKIENRGIVSAVVFAAKNVQPLLDSKARMESLNRYAQLLVTIIGKRDDTYNREQESKNRTIIKAVKRQIPQIRESIARTELSLIDNWQPIYITLHTLKGEMGAFEFEDLRGRLHRTEEYVKKVKEIVKNSRDRLDAEALSRIDQEKRSLLADLHEIEESLIEIEDICRQTGADHSSVVLPRDRLIAIQDDPIQLQQIVVDSLYENLRSIIQGFEPEITKVARDLGKPPPRLLISSPKIYLTEFAADRFKQALTHIIRNSLDHGIEVPEERLRKGKSDIGELIFRVEDRGDIVQIWIRDDGHGLDLKRIHEKAESKNLTQPGKVYSAAELANFVLLPGFSTTQSVSMVSGRGIGMEAIRSLVSELGGTLELKLLDDSENPPIELLLSIPKKHVPRIPTSRLMSLSA